MNRHQGGWGTSAFFLTLNKIIKGCLLHMLDRNVSGDKDQKVMGLVELVTEAVFFLFLYSPTIKSTAGWFRRVNN